MFYLRIAYAGSFMRVRSVRCVGRQIGPAAFIRARLAELQIAQHRLLDLALASETELADAAA